jgi:hypothetical protein
VFTTTPVVEDKSSPSKSKVAKVSKAFHSESEVDPAYQVTADSEAPSFTKGELAATHEVPINKLMQEPIQDFESLAFSVPFDTLPPKVDREVEAEPHAQSEDSSDTDVIITSSSQEEQPNFHSVSDVTVAIAIPDLTERPASEAVREIPTH